MKKMRTLIFSTIGILVAVVVIAILGNVFKAEVQNRKNQESGNEESSQLSDIQIDSTVNEEIRTQFILLYVYKSNDGKTVNAYVIDKVGRKITADLSQVEDADSMLPEDIYQYINEHYYDLNCINYISPADVAAIYSFSKNISDSYGFDEVEGDANAPGIGTMYTLRDFGIMQFLEVYSIGPYTEMPTDPNALAVYHYFFDQEAFFEEYAAVQKEETEDPPTTDGSVPEEFSDPDELSDSYDSVPFGEE